MSATKERHLLQSHPELFQRHFDLPLIGSAITSPQKGWVQVNDRMCEILGYKREELMQTTWEQLTHPEDIANNLSHFNQVLSGKVDGYSIEKRFIRKDRKVVPVALTVQCIRNESGAVEYLVSMCQDLSETKKAEQAVVAQEGFFKSVIDTDPNLVFVKDSSGRYIFVNRQFADFYNTEPEELIGKRDQDFHRLKGEAERFVREDTEVLKTLKVKILPEICSTDANGRARWFQTIKKPLIVPQTGEHYLLGVAIEITQLKLAESEKEKLAAEKIVASRLSVIGQLTAGVAHDFNNILGAILAQANLLQLKAQPNSEAARAGDLIARAVKKAEGLTTKLLGTVRSSKSQNCPVDLHSTVKETIALLERTIDKSINIVQEFRAPISLVMGDPTQLHQVILNLAVNARDALTEHVQDGDGEGEIRFSSTVVEISEPKSINGFDILAGHYLRLTVSDTGCGIPQALHRKIFDPFFTTKGPHKGTGLGLSVVHGIVKDHDGFIELESQEGRGSHFMIYLPIVEGATASLGEHDKLQLPEGRGRIMLIDDEELICTALSGLLDHVGYDVVSFTKAHEAVLYFQKEHASIDLVLMDMVMPGPGAKHFFNELRSINPMAKVVITSGHGRTPLAEQLIKNGALGLIPKPFRLQQLSEMLAAALS